MDDDDVRALLAATIAQNTGAGGDGTVLRLARIGRELMRQRDARSEDFLRVAAELKALKAKLAKARAEVAEEIAQAIEAAPWADEGPYTTYAARTAREHGTEK